MEDKSKNLKVLVIVLIAVIAIFAAVGITMGVLLMNNNSSQTQDTAKQQGVVFDSDASHYEQEVSNADGAEQGIKIPGYPDMTISSESTDFPITLLNPEENPCNFKFTLSLQETGETLCTTDLVKPGDAIKGVTLDKPIEKVPPSHPPQNPLHFFPLPLQKISTLFSLHLNIQPLFQAAKK